MTPLKTLLVPEWLRSYRPADFPRDLAAGAVVAVVLAPQGMAYALLAGLPPIVGLYAATVPLLVYALVGSSRHLSVGPVAIVSLLVHVACSKVAPPGTTAYLAAALQLALLTGLLQLLLGAVRAGFMVNFLSRAAIGGFTSAAALLIALSQMKSLLGISGASGGSALQLTTGLISHLRDIASPDPGPGPGGHRPAACPAAPDSPHPRATRGSGRRHAADGAPQS